MNNQENTSPPSTDCVESAQSDPKDLTPTTDASGGSRAQCTNNLKQIGLG
jgi:hypothetical protein